MISLLQLTKYTDNLYAARWLDDEFGLHFEFNALHDASGEPIGVNREGKAPKLTTGQLSTAQPFREPAPDRHPAYDLADLGIARQPDWANRYTKAAQLVEAGQVRLTGPETAVVQGDSDTYQVNGKCHCRWTQFHDEPCSHYLAVRMARALDQVIEPLTDDEKGLRCEQRRQANKDAQRLRVAARGENKFERARRAQYHNGEGARRYALMAMANGATTIPAHIYRGATGK